MHKSKPSISRQMCACLYAHMSAWLHSPRTVVMGIVILCFTYMHARSFGYLLSIYDHTAHLGETVFWYLNTGFNVVMTSTFILIMVSEIPKRTSFQNSMLVRITRGKWLASQILFCFTVALLMLILMTAFCTVLSLPYIAPGSGWSDLERLAQNPDYQYEVQLVPIYIRALTPLQACLYAGAVVFFFWFTMLLVILLFSTLGLPNAGLLIYIFILQFSLTFRFEMVPGMRTPTHYASLAAVSNQFQGNEITALPLVLSVYFALDITLITLMMLRIRHTDLCFNGKD